MHIVFLCDDTTELSDANLGICCNLAQAFLAQGHQVTILGNCETRDGRRRELRQGVMFRRFYYPINRITHQILNEYGENHSLLGLCAALACHPVTACVDIVRAVTGYNPIERKYNKLLKQVHAETPVDLVIASSGSFYTIHALAKSKVPCRRVGYMLDPYWKNHTTGGRRAKKEELFAWKHLDKMIIPMLLEADYADPSFEAFRGKLVTAEFPGISKPEQGQKFSAFDAEKIKLLFAGNFYEAIRSPEYLLSLVEKLPENVCLYILGGIYGHFSQSICEKMERLMEQGKLKLLNPVSREQAQNAMCQADYLVNLGNSIDNQLPSKLFSYFSTGKPVIHIQKIQNCPCIPYLARYGNMVVLREDQPAGQEANRLLDFFQKGSRVLHFQQVQEAFSDCTAAYVADLILRVCV